MSEYDNTDSGALFKNDKKETDKHPDYRGSLNVGGTDYWISAWLKTSKRGVKFMSLSVSAKDANRTSRADHANATQDDDFDTVLPF
jgi:uncharacterized protein (DUF736 family)